MTLELVETTRLKGDKLVNFIFDEVERLKKEHDLNPYLFGDDDGTADNLAENENFYKEKLGPYGWRIFQAASLLIDLS